MSTLGWFHTTFAVSALVSGAIVVLRSKGTRAHRVTGLSYAASMMGLNVSALTIYRLTGHFNLFHIFAIISLTGLSIGTWFAIARPRKNWLALHLSFMSWSYVGLLAAAASEAGTRIPAFRFWWAVLIATALVISVGGFLIHKNEKRMLARFGKLATQRVRRKPLFMPRPNERASTS